SLGSSGGRPWQWLVTSTLRAASALQFSRARAPGLNSRATCRKQFSASLVSRVWACQFVDNPQRKARSDCPLTRICRVVLLSSRLARPTKFELVTSAFGGQRSIQLSYGRAKTRH